MRFFAFWLVAGVGVVGLWNAAKWSVQRAQKGALTCYDEWSRRPVVASPGSVTQAPRRPE